MSYSNRIPFLPALFLLVVALSSNAIAQKVPAEVEAIAGTFTGKWTSYTLNPAGEVIKQASWTDTIKAERPTVATDRALVETLDEMTFDGGRIPPQKIAGKEGYLLNKDGTLGDYFIEMFGQTIPMKRLGRDTWVYSVPANAREFMSLGDRFVSATHVLVKTTVMDGDVETHNISRVTTLKWKDAAGKEQLTQFVSLQGQHRKSK